MNAMKIFVPIFVLVIAASAAAQEMPSYTDLYVNDFAGIFTSVQTQHMRTLLTSLKSNTTAEIVVVTIPEAAPLSAQEYAHRLFNQWGVGNAEKDNGLVILYAKQENRIWVETGYGLEGILPDSKLGRMLDDYYVPLRDSGDAAQGIVLFTDEVAKVIESSGSEIQDGSSMESIDIIFGVISMIAFFFVIPAVIIIIVFAILWSRRAGKTKDKSGLLDSAVFAGKNSPEQKSYNRQAGALIVVFVIAIFALFFTFSPGFFIIFFFFPVIPRVIRPKCSRDGLRMSYVSSKGAYVFYQCPKGHVAKIKYSSGSSGMFIAGGHGGFGGGGGGFGGGSSGGGGAGR